MIGRMSAVVLLLALACDDKDGDAKSGDAKNAKSGDAKSSDAKSSDAKSSDAKSSDAKPDVKVEGAADRPSDLCKAFDKDAVASALGWSGLSKVSGVGGSGNGIHHRTCSFAGKDAAMEQHFGVSFSTATDFEARHVGFDVKYEPRAAVAGHETRIAKNDRVVILQMKTPELLVTVDATEKGKAPADLEPKLEAAAVALVGSLPPDAKAILDKK
jgi:hypothetical protein